MWPQIDRSAVRGQGFLQGQSLLFKLFFPINFKLLVLEQRMQRGRVSLADINRVIPNFAQKVNFKSWPPAQLGVTGQVRSTLVILGIIRFVAARQTFWYQLHLSITFFQNLWGIRKEPSFTYFQKEREFFNRNVTLIVLQNSNEKLTLP